MAVIIPVQTQTVSNVAAVDRRYVYLISAIAALGGVLFGFDLVIISGTVPFFTRHFNLNEFQTGWAVGCINLGAAIGALIGGKLSDSLGRKKLLMGCAVLFALTGAGTGWAGSFPLFVAFRMLSGVAVGAAALVCPMYVAEISPASMRGRMVSFYQLSIVTGILLAYLSNYLLLNTGVNNWRWMFSSQSVPSLLFFLGLFFVAESPRWLIRKYRNDEAEATLRRIGGGQLRAGGGRSDQGEFFAGNRNRTSRQRTVSERTVAHRFHWHCDRRFLAGCRAKFPVFLRPRTVSAGGYGTGFGLFAVDYYWGYQLHFHLYCHWHD